MGGCAHGGRVFLVFRVQLQVRDYEGVSVVGDMKGLCSIEKYF